MDIIAGRAPSSHEPSHTNLRGKPTVRNGRERESDRRYARITHPTRRRLAAGTSMQGIPPARVRRLRLFLQLLGLGVTAPPLGPPGRV